MEFTQKQLGRGGKAKHAPAGSMPILEVNIVGTSVRRRAGARF